MFGRDDDTQVAQNGTADSGMVVPDTPVTPPVDPASPAPSPSIPAAPAPVAEPAAETLSAGAPAPVTPGAPDTSDEDLLQIKQQALQQLSPLVGHLEQTPEEKFRTTMMMIQAADNQALIKEAYAAA